MFSHCQRAYEQVILLHIGRQTGQDAAVDGNAVDSSPAAHLDVGQRAEGQCVQQSRFSSTTGTHDGQHLSGMGHTTDCADREWKCRDSHKQAMQKGRFA